MKTLIAIAVIAAIAAVAGSVVVGIKSFDGTVTEHPYEAGIIWDDIMRREAELGWTVHVGKGPYFTGHGKILIDVRDKDGGPLKNAALLVMAGRAETSAYDQYADTVKIRDGLFKINVTFPLYGYWIITIEVTQGDDTLSFKKRIFVEKEGRK
jgi:nitrogen fixation protein FixH